MRGKNKYKNKWITIKEGKKELKFQSKKEANRYQELKLMQKSGQIKDLILQPPHVLQEPFRDNMNKRHRAIVYIADFSYLDEKYQWRRVVEDVKSAGTITPVYKLKKKLFLKRYTNLIFFENFA